MSETLTTDPLSSLRSKGTVLRGLALAAAIGALIAPVFSSSSFGVTQTAPLMQFAAFAPIFPTFLALGLISPAIAPLARYGIFADIAAALAGIVLGIVAFMTFADFQSQLAAARRMAGASGLGNAVNLGIATGTYLLAAAILLIGVQVAISLLKRRG